MTTAIFNSLNNGVTAAFGELVTWTDAAGSVREIKGVVFDESTSFRLEQASVDGRHLSVDVKASDASKIAHGDALTVRGESFEVEDALSDGEGMIRVRLVETTV